MTKREAAAAPGDGAPGMDDAEGFMKEKIRLGVSSCLLGEAVRYDGGHQLDKFVTEVLGAYVEYFPVCPEVECGLSIPREAMRLVGEPDAPRLVTARSGVDHTARMEAWAARRVSELERENLGGFIFKSRSPSSGMERVKLYSPDGAPPTHKGVGLFARAFMAHFPRLPVEEDGRLHDAALRENFIERIFVFQRWRRLLAGRPTLGALVDFHATHKLLVLSHSPVHEKKLGRIVGIGKGRPPAELFDEYEATLCEALTHRATNKKHTNVLSHMMGFFKKELTADEKQELLDVLGRYHAGELPLIVPITLMSHYVRKFKEPYLSRQVYLKPHPAELMLRNHV